MDSGRGNNYRRDSKIDRCDVRVNLRASFIVACAVIFGVIVLLGYFIQIPVLINLRTMFVNWAVILIAVLFLVGAINLARTHWHKVTTSQPGGIYSLILLVTLLITILTLVIERLGLFGGFRWAEWLLKYVTIPVESSLVAILAIVLIHASVRLFKRRLNLFSVIFIITALFIMVATASLPGVEIPGLKATRDWVMQVPASAGARGILLGVSLGTIATGLRILIGADQPYGG